MLIAGVGVMQQWDLAICGDQQSQSQKPKMFMPLFSMATLRQLGPQVEAVEESKKVGGIKDQAPQIQAEAGDCGLGQILFDGGDLFGADSLHVVPKALTAELVGGDGQEAAERGFAVPMSDAGFAGRRKTTVKCSE
jgi:hypothetical protein